MTELSSTYLKKNLWKYNGCNTLLYHFVPLHSRQYKPHLTQL